LRYGQDYEELMAYSQMGKSGIPLRPDVFVSMDQTVNSIFIGTPGKSEFVLIDTGMPNRAESFIRTAKELFGEEAKPRAILLTHGHFDHVGSIIELVEKWQVPVYAHKKELPYLTGKKKYDLPKKPADDSPMKKQAKVKSPVEAIDLGSKVHPLPENGEVPFLPDFEWIPTPGHSPGQVAFYRKEDGMLIAGDAFITTSQTDLFNVLVPEKTISGPPQILTTDWETAKESVQRLMKLYPKVGVTGHGVPLRGEELLEALHYLIENWDTVALPAYLQKVL